MKSRISNRIPRQLPKRMLIPCLTGRDTPSDSTITIHGGHLSILGTLILGTAARSTMIPGTTIRGITTRGIFPIIRTINRIITTMGTMATTTGTTQAITRTISPTL